MADFDVQRRPIRERIESLRSDAAKAYADFLDASTERMRAAWSDGVRKFVENDEPETTQALGRQAVGALKLDMAKLDANARDIVQRELDRLPAWKAYREDDPRELGETYNSLDFRSYHSTLQYDKQNRLPQELTKALDEAVKEASVVLRKHGWGKETDKAYQYPGSSGYRPVLVRFPSEVTPDLRDPIIRYSRAADELAQARKELRAIDEAESRSKAKSIWDDA